MLFEYRSVTNDLQGKWQKSWPGLRDEIDALVLVAFRLLVCRLDQDSFFLIPSQIDAHRDCEHPLELTILLGTRDSRQAAGFAQIVADRLGSDHLSPTAMLTFAIDATLGAEFAGHLDTGDRDHLQIVAKAVNAANRVLRELGTDRPTILVRSPRRYWSGKQDAAPDFLGPLQTTASNFHHLLPVATQLSRVDYSAVGSGCAPKLTVALWPAKAPLIDSPAITTRTDENGTVWFRFKRWEDLRPDLQEPHTALADRIARYVREAPDVFDSAHIVAAPELMLAPQSHDSIIDAIASRKNAPWIVFPGTYHIESGNTVVNQAPIYVGGALEQTELASPVSAVKRTAFVISGKEGSYVEDLDGSVCSLHLVDSNVGRIAVMICLDYLVPALRRTVVEMGADHLFVLSMSPDGGGKFKRAMDIETDFQTGSFLVNAYTETSWRAEHRRPLKDRVINPEQPAGDEQPWVYILETKWNEELTISSDGIVRRCDPRVAIGAVLLIENDAGEIVVVTKAPKPGYEFGDLDVLPGGLLRSKGFGRIRQSDLRQITIKSLSSRAKAEAGFLSKAAPVAIDLDPPPTTSYTVRGKRRYVVVLPHVVKAKRDFSPCAADNSVKTARWVDPLEVVPNLAPANCIIISKFIWPRLGPAAREKCRPSIEKAAGDCQRWAKEAGMPPVDMTWLL